MASASPPLASGVHYRPPMRGVQYPRPNRVTVTEALARSLGKTPGWAHARLYGYPRLVDVTVAAVRAYRDAGDVKALAAFAGLLRDALEDVQVPRFGPQLVHSEARADGEEDQAQAAFLLHPCRETALAYVQKLDLALATTRQLRGALAEQYLA